MKKDRDYLIKRLEKAIGKTQEMEPEDIDELLKESVKLLTQSVELLFEANEMIDCLIQKQMMYEQSN